MRMREKEGGRKITREEVERKNERERRRKKE